MDQSRLSAICLTKDQPLAAAVACIDASGGQIALVVDDAGRLLGTITDGDIRRAILGGIGLDSPSSDAMNPKPHFATKANLAEISARLEAEDIAQMPILDTNGVVVDIVFADDLRLPGEDRHHAVIMAGGLGTRLRPITETIPKPMIPINGRPILEIIIERFRDQGFKHLTLCLNHLADVIVDHFRDGKELGVEIRYIYEKKPMGTAGALSLINPTPREPVIVMNGDILTEVNFSSMLSFHSESNALVTMALNRYQYKVPYGVVDLDGHFIQEITEKPAFDLFVNAGIYVIDPAAFDLIPDDCFFEMPSLFEKVEPNLRVAFPIHEYWLDIGRHDDLERAIKEYEHR